MWLANITNVIIAFFWKHVMTILGSMCEENILEISMTSSRHNLIPFLNHVNPRNIVNKLLVAILILVAQKSTLYFLRKFQLI